MSSKQSTEKEEQKCLFWNLLALGLNPQSVEEKYRCQIDENTFNKSNKRAFEVIAHFLFHKLNSKQATELFRNCYPCSDKKTTQEFRKVCYNWLKRIAEENRSFGFPRVNASIFVSPGEKDFVYLMLIFSTFVLHKLTTAVHPEGILRPVTLPPKQLRLSQVQINTLAAMTVQDFKELQNNMKLVKKTDEELQNFADTQLDTYHSLQKKKQFLMQRKRSLLGDTAKFPKTRLADIQHTQKENLESKIQHARALWKRISSTVEEGSSRREIMESVIGKNQQSYKIDGNQLQINVSAKLVDQCQEEVYRLVGTSLYKGGKVNLPSLVSLGNLSLSLVADNIHEGGLPNFEKQGLWLKTQAEIHDEQLSKLLHLSEKIKQESAKKEESISNLEKELDALYEASAINRKEPGTAIGIDVPDSLTSDSVPCESSINTTEQLSNETTTSDHQESLLKMALYPSDEDLESMLHSIMYPSDFTQTPDSSMSGRDVSRHTDMPYQAWVVNTRPHTPKTSRLKELPKQSRRFEKPIPSARAGLTQGKQRHVAFDDRISAGLRKHLALSLTPDGKRTTISNPSSPQAPRSRGRKSMSLPSSPMINCPDDDVTIERVVSRTPKADQKLIEKIVDSTLQTDDDPPLIVYEQNTRAQLDRSAFVSLDKIPRTPPSSDVSPSLVQGESPSTEYTLTHMSVDNNEAGPSPFGAPLSTSSDEFSLHPAFSCAPASPDHESDPSSFPRSYCETVEMDEGDRGEDVIGSNSASSTPMLKHDPQKIFSSKFMDVPSDPFSPAQASLLNEDHKKASSQLLRVSATDQLHSSSTLSRATLLSPLGTSRGQDCSTSSAMDNALMSLLDGNTSNTFDLSSPSFAELSDDEEELVPVTDSLVPLDDKPEHTPPRTTSHLLVPNNANPIDLLMSTPPPMDLDGRKENLRSDCVSSNLPTKGTGSPDRPLLQEFHLNLLPTSQDLMGTPDLQRFKSIGPYKSKQN